MNALLGIDVHFEINDIILYLLSSEASYILFVKDLLVAGLRR